MGRSCIPLHGWSITRVHIGLSAGKKHKLQTASRRNKLWVPERVDEVTRLVIHMRTRCYHAQTIALKIHLRAFLKFVINTALPDVGAISLSCIIDLVRNGHGNNAENR